MLIYVVMAFWAAIGLIFNARLASMLALSLAPTGAIMTFIALWTGAVWGKPTWGTWWVWDARLTSELVLLFLYFGFLSLHASIDAPTGAIMTFIALWTGAVWGKPTWGTWWVWDARLTSELVLLFLYFGFLSLHASIDDVRKADRSAALLAIVGVVNVPIIYFSVKWWNTLHQGASISLTKAPTMATQMLTGMLIMVFAFWMYSLAVALYRCRILIIERERHTQWVRETL